MWSGFRNKDECLFISRVCGLVVELEYKSYKRPTFRLTYLKSFIDLGGGGPRVVVSTAAFHAKARGSVHDLGGLKKKMFISHPRVKVSIVGRLRARAPQTARARSNFESCVWRTVSSHSSHHPQEVLLAQFSLCTKVV